MTPGGKQSYDAVLEGLLTSKGIIGGSADNIEL